MNKTKRAPNKHLPPGFSLGRYLVQKKMSSGGFGVVYACIRDDGAQVAIKEYLPSSIPCRTIFNKGKIVITDEAQAPRYRRGLASFFDEADTLAKISSPQVIPVWDVFQRNGTAYFVMPLERGQTLYSWIKSSQGPIPDAIIQKIFAEAAHGVSILHDHGLLHLDIKPANLWVRPDGQVVVLDLGASWWEEDTLRRHHAARTPGFAAPEQHSKKTSKPDQRTDVYGLGATMWAALMSGDPPPPAPIRTEIDAPLESKLLGMRSPSLLRFIDKAVAISKEDRWRNASEFRDRLMAMPRLKKTMISPLRWPASNQWQAQKIWEKTPEWSFKPHRII